MPLFTFRTCIHVLQTKQSVFLARGAWQLTEVNLLQILSKLEKFCVPLQSTVCYLVMGLDLISVMDVFSPFREEVTGHHGANELVS